ncbi:MAG: hypothetical protein ABEJ27_02800 [Halodesulfurarchaeum sp.]
MNLRDVLAWIGVFLGSAGLLTAFAPGTVLGLNLAVPPVPLVGLVTLLLALGGYVARRRATFVRASPPTVEKRVSVPEPGVAVDESLQTAASMDIRATSERETLEDRLRQTATDVLMATRGCDRSEALEYLEEGTWTADQRARAFFQTDPSETPLSDVIRGVVTGRSQFSRNARHVIGALDAELRNDDQGVGDFQSSATESMTADEAEQGDQNGVGSDPEAVDGTAFSDGSRYPGEE